MEQTQLIVQIQDPEERARLCGALRAWAVLHCASVALATELPEEPPRSPVILFWDLDREGVPPSLPAKEGYALFVCSSDSRNAIRSYSFHPDGFLRKPIGVDQVEKAMRRCVPLWWGALDRLEILSGRIRIRVPFCNVIQVEGTRKGCLIHTFLQKFAAREPLYSLEERLPEQIFVRCQRSFVVNLCHVRALSRRSIRLSDGTEITLGRLQKDTVEEAYRKFRLLRDGEVGQ